MSLSSKKYYGLEGENKVVTFLIQHNYTILENEIFLYEEAKLILSAQKNDTIAFVEVKTRNIAYFNTSQVVTHTKQKNYFAAKQYLLRHPSLKKSPL